LLFSILFLFDLVDYVDGAPWNPEFDKFFSHICSSSCIVDSVYMREHVI
jgi:hypothetical protein